MPAADCLPQVHVCAMALGFLNPDGSPMPGAHNAYVSNALTKFTSTPNIRTATEIEEPNGCDVICVAYQGPPSLKWGDVEIDLCSPDPHLEAFLSGGATIANPDGEEDPPGFAAPAIGLLTPTPVGVELWAKRILNGDIDPDYPYARWVYPKIINLASGARSHEVPSQKPIYTGRALENPNYGDGVLGDWPATSDRYEQWIPVKTLPVASCGPIALPAS